MRLHGANYSILIYSICRGFNFYKIRLVYITYVSNLFREVIPAWYDPILRQHELEVAFNGLRRFFIRVCSITWLGLFVCLEFFPSPRFA